MKLNSGLIRVIFLLTLALIPRIAEAQRDRGELPGLLNNSYFDVNVGYINYPFGAKNLESGFTFQSVKVPHVAVRVIIFGHEFNKYLSAQVSYLRPVLWVKYTFNSALPESTESRTVWMNVAGLTLKPQLSVTDYFTIFGEGGLAIITRHGFTDKIGTPVVTNANYASFLVGGGIKYSISNSWRLQLSLIYSPENAELKQPSTTYISTGFSYRMLRNKEKKEKPSETKYFFSKQMIIAGYSSNILGYGVNDFFANDKVPVFWGGDVQVQNGFVINYLRNIYHGRKIFSFDWGTGLGVWKSKETGESFFTLSVFPVFRWTVLYTKPADFYLFYSLAGPTFISKTVVDGNQIGKKFTFQDYMGTGWFMGKNRKINVELRISHYSNGNLFTSNPGVMIPLSLNLGYSFK